LIGLPLLSALLSTLLSGLLPALLTGGLSLISLVIWVCHKLTSLSILIRIIDNSCGVASANPAPLILPGRRPSPPAPWQ
jgi:hypothetical protein